MGACPRVIGILSQLRLGIATLLLIAATAAAQEQTAVSAPEKTWQSTGVRSGFSSRDFPHDPFLQSELFNVWNLPWRWRLCDSWSVKPRLELTAGCLSGKEENGFVGTLGPELAFQCPPVPIVFDVGIRPTWLSRYSFGYRDLGLHFQLTSHVGLDWEFSTHWKIGYRFQHMSNAGLGTPNPGLNLHMFELGYRF